MCVNAHMDTPTHRHVFSFKYPQCGQVVTMDFRMGVHMALSSPSLSFSPFLTNTHADIIEAQLKLPAALKEH